MLHFIYTIPLAICLTPILYWILIRLTDMKYIARLFGKYCRYQQCDFSIVEWYKLFWKFYHWKHTTVNDLYKNYKIKL